MKKSDTVSIIQTASTITSEAHPVVAGWHVVPGTEERCLIHEDGRAISFADAEPVPGDPDYGTPGAKYLRAKWGGL